VTPSAEDGYRSVDDGVEAAIKVKASRFIGQVFRADNEDCARERCLEIRKRHHDARHHCSAWRIGGIPPAVERSDDDGEPSGTAGPPILEAVRRAAVTDVAVIVTRWFGGTKLGRGGLVRAYDEAATLALDAAPRRTVWLDVMLLVGCDYGDVGAVEAVIARFGSAIVDVTRCFDARPEFQIRVRRSGAADLAADLTEGTSGRCNVSSAG